MKQPNERQFDQALRQALYDVEVPEDLQERLLRSLQPTAELARPSSSGGTDVAASPSARPTFLSRRRSLALVGCAAAVLLAVGAGVQAWVRSRHIIEQEQIASALGGWQQALTKSHAQKGLPSDFALPPLAVNPVKYVPFRTEEGWSAVAVDCTPPAGTPATLFIVRSSARFRVPAAPYTRLSGANGKSVAAWQEGRLLYVLVVEDSDGQRLEEFVRRPAYLRTLKRRPAVRST